MRYAYIKYVQDGKRAVLPVSLIQRFCAKSNDDLPSASVKAYWRMPNGDEEGYYDAHVLHLAETESEVCRYLAKIKRVSVPVIFTEDGKIKEVERPRSHENETSGPAKKQRPANGAAPTAKEMKRKKKIAQDRRMGEFLPPKSRSRAPQHSHSDTDSSGDDELCLKSELRRAKRTIRRLEVKLERSEHTNRRLTNALLLKIVC
ncbi:uncharacterized protein LOC115319760 [Ixodes scapularis]|uniref:uncharacterized protein LOC115319760 n=1 Tax=Ixodes scapularis TaxID=6945 RepID=UPI001A9E3847|nr:uncharacterized protein LOC115319760 [Ixodes scapularis]